MSLPPLATAAPAALTLQDAVRIAVARAPLLEARQAGVVAAREESARADALPDPVLTAGVDNLPVTGAHAFDAHSDEMTMARIGLRQELPARSKRAARKALATRQVAEAVARSDAERLAVRRAAAEAWIDLWSAQRQLDALQALREQAALLVAVTRARVAGGRETAGTALAAEAAVLEMDSRIEAARATKATAQADLQRWVGEAEPDVAGPAPDFDSLPMPEAQLLAAVDRLGALLPVTAQLETAEAAVDVARAEKRPDWSVGVAYGHRSGGRSDMILFEVGIGLPLFPRNRQDRGVAAREADYQAALAAREDLRRQESARIRAHVARWHGLRRQVALHEAALLPLARDRSAAALAAYRGGGELQPWLDARRDELDAHLSHVAHLNELGRTWVALTFLLSVEDQP